jgi:hypothetical protein
MISKRLFWSLLAGVTPLVWTFLFVNRFRLTAADEMFLWVVIPFVMMFFAGIVYGFPTWKEGS